MADSTPHPTQPPVAPRKPHSFTHHGITVEDPYAWLRDPGYPEVTDKEVLAHLEAENAWFEARVPGPVASKVIEEYMKHHGWDLRTGRMNRQQRRANKRS